MSLLEMMRPSKKEEEEEAPPSHKGTMHIGGRFIPFEWDTADPISVEQARTMFDIHRRSGYSAQAYGGTAAVAGYSGSITRKFDPEVDEIRMTLPYAGG